MTPLALAGLLGLAVWAPVPAARATDKISCVVAHEAAQEFRQQNRLVQAREQLLLCSNSSCPRLVAEECQVLLADVERLSAPDNVEESPAEVPAPPAVAEDDGDRETNSAPAPAPRAPLRATPSSRGPPSRDGPARIPGVEPWRAPLVPGALTVVALASAAYFGWHGLWEAQRLGRTCSPDCDPAQVSPIRRELLVADLSLIAGVGFGALTAWTIWKGRTREAPAPEASNKAVRGAPAAAAGWSLVPRLGALQVEYGGRF